MSTRRCPECGGENRTDAVYCMTCGGDLSSGGVDRNGRLLFFSTPFLFLLVGIAFAWDLGMENPVETGISLGLSLLSLVFLVTGGVAWIICRMFGFPFSPTFPWRAGMFGTVQLFATAFLALPLQVLLIPSGFASMTLYDEERLKIGIVFALYLPLLLTGLVMSILRERLPEALAGTSPRGAVGDEAGRPREDVLAGHPRVVRVLGRFGAAPILVGTILAGSLLVALLPAHQREFLFARLAGDFNQTERALRSLDASLGDRPDFPSALNLKGLLLYGRAKDPADIETAVSLLRRAGELEPGNPRFQLGLALVLDRIGRSEEAERAASQAVDILPKDATLWSALADVRLKNGKREEAVQAYRQALSLDPGDARTMNNLAFTLLELNVDLGSALQLARASVERQPGYVYNLDTLAWALYKNGQLGEAYETLHGIREGVGSPSAEIDLHFAIIAQEMGVLPEPRASFESLWERPEVQADPQLRNLVTAAIASLGVAIRTVGTATEGASLPAELAPLPGASPGMRPPQASGSALDGSNEPAPPRLEPASPFPATSQVDPATPPEEASASTPAPASAPAEGGTP